MNAKKDIRKQLRVVWYLSFFFLFTIVCCCFLLPFDLSSDGFIDFSGILPSASLTSIDCNRSYMNWCIVCWAAFMRYFVSHKRIASDCLVGCMCVRSFIWIAHINSWMRCKCHFKVDLSKSQHTRCEHFISLKW